MLIKDILHANPELEFYKDVFILKSKKKKIIKSDNKRPLSVEFYPGYATSFIETEGGCFLNVTLKNKIYSIDNILKYLKYNKYKDSRNQERIKRLIIGRSFKPEYSKRNYIIDDISFDRNPQNQKCVYQGKSVNLVNYYLEKHDIQIKDINQPLLMVKAKGPQGKKQILYFIPELCYFSGLNDEATKDRTFMKLLSKETKLTQKDRIEKTNEFLKIFGNNNKKDDISLSAKEKYKKYGIEIKPINNNQKAYYMKETILTGKNNKLIKPRDKIFEVLEKKDFLQSKWVCFYERDNYNEADLLHKTLSKASKAYGIIVE